MQKKGFNNYYEDIYAFLISKEKAFNEKIRKLIGIKLYIQVILNPQIYQKNRKIKKDKIFDKCDKFIISDNTLKKKIKL